MRRPRLWSGDQRNEPGFQPSVPVVGGASLATIMLRPLRTSPCRRPPPLGPSFGFAGEDGPFSVSFLGRLGSFSRLRAHLHARRVFMSKAKINGPKLITFISRQSLFYRRFARPCHLVTRVGGGRGRWSNLGERGRCERWVLLVRASAAGVIHSWRAVNGKCCVSAHY